MTDFLLALIGAALVSNLVLGLPLAADSLRQDPAAVLGPAGALLIAIAAPLGWALQHLLLRPLALEALQPLFALPLLALLANLVLRLLRSWRPAWPTAGLRLPLLANGAGLGALLQAASPASFAAALAFGLGGGLGFWLVLRAFADLLARSAAGDVPAPFQGVPLRLIAAGLMGLAFLGFKGWGPA
ncbi:Rnf-Nqr domain containing protein [Pseudomonas sp. RIT-PI-AD]|uniref:Rnf-Nqr domain containing protein n=1 Tax=Pseudomonas sp. RIT-PI-AD TaxID=3035294 RepID=UPI0021DB7DC4|nr:Rnf-Nqr domain containing protein [Pseudomonas sp. RIT-PI-AD]